MQWDAIKLKMQDRKEKWANEWRECAFGYTKGVKRVLEKRQNGEIYGFTLKPPFSKEELEKIITDNELESLPDSLHHYLITISREIFCYCYPHVFNGLVDTHKSSNIPVDTDYICTDDLYREDFEYEPDYYPNEKNGEYIVPFATIGEGGCSYSHKIILYGNQAGSVWSSYDGYISKKNKTFEEYLCEKFL
jgi:hypothetical protein